MTDPQPAPDAPPKRKRIRNGPFKRRARLPNMMDRARRCTYSAQLRWMFKQSWEEIAATLWPLDEEGKPVEGAKPMWPNANTACQAVTRFQDHLRRDVFDQFTEVMVSHSMQRQMALANAVMAGDPIAIQLHRAEDQWLATVLGQMPTQKVAFTTPDGTKPASGVLVAPVAMEPEAWADTAKRYMESLVALKAPEPKTIEGTAVEAEVVVKANGAANGKV